MKDHFCRGGVVGCDWDRNGNRKLQPRKICLQFISPSMARRSRSGCVGVASSFRMRGKFKSVGSGFRRCVHGRALADSVACTRARK
jgi:hypothetical protein